MIKKPLIWMLMLGSSMFFVSCDDDDDNAPDEPENEEELITTVKLHFVEDNNPSDTTTYSWQDLDGPGGDAPQVVNGRLDSNTIYQLSLEFLNEQESPVEDITEEIRNEDEEHQVFFLLDASVDALLSYEDNDEDGNPIGLSNQFSAGTASSGDLEVILRHKPDKFAPGVADGLIENAGGETDVQVTFDIIID